MNPQLTATQLEAWAAKRVAQGTLPLLVRRLILSSCNPAQIDFPAGDSVNRPGYDGILRIVEGTSYVPNGQSVWELGTDKQIKQIKQKADADYSTRTSNPGSINPRETTFVFATPRRWQGKRTWMAKKAAENAWAGVLAFDADDLEQWLEHCPAVAAWARREIAGTPSELRDLAEIWESWSTRTNPALTPQFFAAGSQPLLNRIRAWLDGQPSILRVRADTSDEALGFVAAAIYGLDEGARDSALARAVLVNSPEAWRWVGCSLTPSILMATSTELGAIPPALDRGHRILIAYGNDSVGIPVDVEIAPYRRDDLEQALQALGLERRRASELASESRGRLGVLVDLLGGALRPPLWANPGQAPTMLPLFLAGSWSSSPADLEAIGRLSRISSKEVGQLCSRWANDIDPPIRSVGRAWDWVSRIRAWPYLGRYLLDEDLDSFCNVATEVLGELDPKLALPADERWMASLRNCSARYSSLLKKGFAETLALLASLSDGFKNAEPVRARIYRTVFAIFETGEKPSLWHSLSPLLSFFAEASPEALLELIERDVLGVEDVFRELFREEGPFSGSQHHHLLWALETMAWSSDHLSRAATVLARLAVQDPGGRTVNRPSASLRTIFLPWRPHTSATARQRLSSLDSVVQVEPRVGFDLLANLLPDGYDTVTPTPRPRYRKWADEEFEDGDDHAYHGYVLGLFDRALALANDDPYCWSRLLKATRSLPPDRLEQLFAELEALPLESMANEDNDQLRGTIREILHLQRTVPGLYSSLTGDYSEYHRQKQAKT